MLINWRSSMKNVACFDVGGTFIKYGIVNEHGEIIEKSKMQTPNHDCNVEIPKMINDKVEELKNKHRIDAVGISTAGKVDSDKGVVVFASDNLPKYSGAKLADEISDKLGIPCYVENDVNAAALAESWMGASKGVDTFVCVTLGTGIGGAIIINGKLFKGVMGGSGEVGHMIVSQGGEKCNCGSNGCYERYASTSSLVRSYSNKSGLPMEELNGKVIFDKINEKQPLAMEVYNEFLENIVIGLVNITHIFDPGLIVIGGGISAQGEPFFKDLNDLFKKKVMSSYGEYTSIVPAQLGNDAGILGACYISLNQ